MSIAVICIGTELLTGETLNSNLKFLGEQLNEYGIVLGRSYTVHDDPDTIQDTMAQAFEHHSMIISIGGLGPTRDDLTKATVADFMDMPLYLDQALAEKIRDRYFGRNPSSPDSAWQSQGQVPEGATILPNDWGTAPGLWCEKDGKVVLMLPGPPRELHPIFTNHAMANIKERFPVAIMRESVSIFGMGESTVEKGVEEALKGIGNIDYAFCIKGDRCHVRLSVDKKDADALEKGLAALYAHFGNAIGKQEETLVSQIADLCREKNYLLATAESCTGGGISSFITDLPGISDVFAGSIITYSNEMKMNYLGVKKETIDAHGAVSEETAREMVAGLLKNLNVQVGIAVTGIAGPDGGTEEKPTGTVHITTAVNNEIVHNMIVLKYDRAGVRTRTVIKALNQLRHQLLTL
ncbi:MAG: competence/damage-inducible protein A [Lentisphaeria bacterium]|nr:competence/damage-inducible protein A [Lentisphaeria bacterium]NQZ67169.1 competence/damage-inducible protein A [Lentisphaeria bacterium]